MLYLNIIINSVFSHVQMSCPFGDRCPVLGLSIRDQSAAKNVGGRFNDRSGFVQTTLYFWQE